MIERRCRETFYVRAFGPSACFTRPEFKVERVSYEAITPSAARGLLEAVYWKKAIRWVVTAIQVLRPIRFISFKRNEVKSLAGIDVMAKTLGKDVRPVLTDVDRAQRNTVALRDVEYIIEAHFVATGEWKVDDTMQKHVSIFKRRLEDGQTFHQPYLGCREFAAAVEPGQKTQQTAISSDELPRCLGLMLHDLEFGETIRPRFFQARIDPTGWIKVPTFASASPEASAEDET